MGGLPTSTVNGFAADPANPRVMYVAMRDGVFRSEDAGGTWSRTGGPANAAAVTVNPARPRNVYAATADGAIWRSTDGGDQWNAVR